MFGALSLENAPGELAELVDELTVLLPWGSLLRAVAQPDAAHLARLLAMLRPASGTFRFVFGYGAIDARAAALPSLEDASSRAALAALYQGVVGGPARIRALDLAEVRALRTTWASKLAFAGHARRFVEITGPVG